MSVSFGITFCVAVSKPDVLNRNFLASPCLHDSRQFQILLQWGFSSAALAYNDAINRSVNDVIVFVHQDVYLPAGWIHQLQDSRALVEQNDPRWGVLGSFGIVADGTCRGYVCSSTQGIHGRPFEKPQPVQTLDEIVLIMRKSSGLRFDESLPHFHLYGTDICLAAAQENMLSYAICAPCIHNTVQGPILPSQFYECCSRIRRKWKSALPIQTACVQLTRSGGAVYKRRLYQEYLYWTGRHTVKYRYGRIEDMLGDLAGSQHNGAYIGNEVSPRKVP